MAKIPSIQKDDTIYLGIDVHEKTYSISVFSEGQQIHHQHSKASYSVIHRLLERYKALPVRAVYEAGAFGYGLYDRLKADGVDAIVTPPSKIPVVAGDKVKTDSRDSFKLAQLLSVNMLGAVTVPTQVIREDRELLRTRDQLVSERTRVFHQIQSKLRFHDLPLRCKGQVTTLNRESLLALPMALSVKRAFEELLDLYQYLTTRLKQFRRWLLELAQSEKYHAMIELLQSLPGIGLMTALAWVLEVPPIQEFKSADKLASFLGLTPSESSSGGSRHQGHITRCGNSKIRWLLCECAWTAIRKDKVIEEYYQRIKRTRGAKRAIVAVARKLSARIRAVLIHQVPYAVGTVQ
jgi:transposase